MTSQEDKMIAIAMPGQAAAGRAQRGGAERRSNEQDWALEGIFTSGAGPEPGGAVIAPPHPLYGGSMDSPVVAEITWACKRAGFATVRFNWRGVGASGGSPSGENAHADTDYVAALAYLEDTVPGPIIAAGYSFGAATAVRIARASPRVRRLLLVAPPPALLDAGALAGFRGRVLAVVGSRDSFAPVAELAASLGDDPRRRLEVVPDADHFFQRGLSDVSRLAGAWLGAQTPEWLTQRADGE